MKRILLYLGLASATVTASARKAPTAVKSYYVNPQHSIHVRFNGAWMGTLTPKNSMDWLYHDTVVATAPPFFYEPASLPTQSKNDLLDDCVYFDPAVHACVWGSSHAFFNSHFFINPVTDTSGYGIGTMIPSSVRFYVDAARLSVAADNVLNSDTFPDSLVQDYLRPFYFRKYEVSNKEYREFVQWVTDSIARTRLGYFLPDGKLDRKKEYNIYERGTDDITHLFGPMGERFYSRKNIDARKLNYRFSKRPGEYAFDTINIYPDTLSWLHDWPHFFNKSISNLYFWHPEYDAYAVAGVNYWQCLAFLEWKTMQLNQALKGKYKVQCMLPAEMEWDYVTTAENYKGSVELIGSNYPGSADDSWFTDLNLWYDTTSRHIIYRAEDFPAETETTSPTSGDVLYTKPARKPIRGIDSQSDEYSKPLKRLSLAHEKTWGDFVYDQAFHTAPVKIRSTGFAEKHPKYRTPNERTMAHYDNATGICWLDGNVSEWMREDLDKNWRGIFSKHMVVMDGPYAEEEKLIRNYEKYYYDRLPEHGKLVRGCNWYDERFGMRYGKNVAGTQAKTFCDPNTAHSTLGFRYVIYIEEK